MSSYQNAFILATCVGVSACGTVKGIGEDISSAVGVVTGTSTSQPAAQAQARPAEPIKGSNALHPAIQPYINQITAERGQSFDSNQCPADQLSGKPIGPVTSQASAGNVPGKGVDLVTRGVRGLFGTGTAGQIAAPTIDGIGAETSAKMAQAQRVCTAIGRVNVSFIQADARPGPYADTVYRTGYSQLGQIMKQAADGGMTSGTPSPGASAISNRGFNQSQTIGWTKLLNGIHKPDTNVLDDAIRRVGPR